MTTNAEISLVDPRALGAVSDVSSSDVSENSTETKSSRFSSLFPPKSKSSFSFLNYQCKFNITIQKKSKFQKTRNGNGDSGPTPTPTPRDNSPLLPEFPASSSANLSVVENCPSRDVLTKSNGDKPSMSLSKGTLPLVLFSVWSIAHLNFERGHSKALEFMLEHSSLIIDAIVQYGLFTFSTILYASLIMLSMQLVPANLLKLPTGLPIFYVGASLLLVGCCIGSVYVTIIAIKGNPFLPVVLLGLIWQAQTALLKMHSVFIEQYWRDSSVLDVESLNSRSRMERLRTLFVHYFSFFLIPTSVYENKLKPDVQPTLPSSAILAKLFRWFATLFVGSYLFIQINHDWRPLRELSVLSWSKEIHFGLRYMLQILAIIVLINHGIELEQEIRGDVIRYEGELRPTDWWNCEHLEDFFVRWCPNSIEWVQRYCFKSMDKTTSIAAAIVLSVAPLSISIWWMDYYRWSREGLIFMLCDSLAASACVLVTLQCLFLLETCIIRPCHCASRDESGFANRKEISYTKNLWLRSICHLCCVIEAMKILWPIVTWVCLIGSSLMLFILFI